MKKSIGRGCQYLKVAVVVIVTYAVPAIAECEADELATLVLRQPVSCKLIHSHFSRDIIEKTKGKDETNAVGRTFAEVRKTAKETAEDGLRTKFNTKTHSEVNSVVSPAGAAAVGTSHIELNTLLDFSMNKKREKEDELEKKTISELRNKSQSISEWSTSDWKLRVTLIFKNNTPDKKFVVKKGGSVLAEIDGMQIKIPIEEDFYLTPEGESPRKLFDVPVSDGSIKNTLFAYEAYYGHLEEKLKLVVDANLSYQEVDSNITKVPTRESNPLSVFVDFGDAKEESPVKVRSFHGDNARHVTYGEALRAVKLELSKAVPNLFDFDEQGGLAKVLDIKFGAPDGDSIVLARIAGMIKYKLQEEDLKEWPARGGNKKELRFEKIALREIAERPKRYDGKLREICKEAIAQKRGNGEVLSFDEKYCAAMLHYNEGELKESYQYFADMTKEDYEKMDAGDVDKCIILVLAIQETVQSNDSFERINKLIQQLCITNKEQVAFVEFAIREGNLGAYRALIENGFTMCQNTERTDLGYASACGRMEIAKWLLCECPRNMRPSPDEIPQSASLASSGDVGKTPIFWAAKNGHLEMCKFLVEQGADVNRRFFEKNKKLGTVSDFDELVDPSYVKDERIRKYIEAEREIRNFIPDGWAEKKFIGRAKAWWKEKPEIPKGKLKEWFDAGVPPERQFFRRWDLYKLAIDAGDDDLVLHMVTQTPGMSRNATPNGTTAAMLAIASGNTNLVAKLVSLGGDATSMLKQTLNDPVRYYVFKFLIDKGADIKTKSDDNGFTPLMWAAKMNDTNMVARLLSKGAEVNAVYKETCKTALCMAIEKGNSDAVRLLLPKASKEVLIKDEWRELNFYQFAAMHLKDRQLLETIFSDKKAHDADGDGITPLMAAAYTGNLEAVKFLVDTKKEKADEHDKSFWGGNTALDYAEKQKMSDVVAYLKLLQGEVKK